MVKSIRDLIKEDLKTIIQKNKDIGKKDYGFEYKNYPIELEKKSYKEKFQKIYFITFLIILPILKKLI